MIKFTPTNFYDYNSSTNFKAQNQFAYNSIKNKTEPTKSNSKGKALIGVGIGAALLIVFKNKIKPIKNWFNNLKLSFSKEKGIASKSIKACRNITTQDKQKLSESLKPYLERIQRENKLVTPSELDFYIMQSGEVANKYEQFFVPNYATGVTKGRKMVYELKSGKKIILESHNQKFNDKDIVSRIYDDCPRSQRNYLFPDGNFHTNAYRSEEAHLPTDTKSGLNWINRAKR